MGDDIVMTKYSQIFGYLVQKRKCNIILDAVCVCLNPWTCECGNLFHILREGQTLEGL
jgi:hypothetical protein